MTASTSATDPLKAVYAATASQAVAAAYDEWAERYDADMAKVGYRHLAIAILQSPPHSWRAMCPRGPDRSWMREPAPG